MNNKKILFIVSEDWYFYSHRLELAIEGIKRGNKISLLTNYQNHKNLIKKNNIETYELGNFRGKLSFINELKNLYTLYKIINLVKPNIIHAVSIKISIYSAIINIVTKTNTLVAAISGLGYHYTSKKKSSIIYSYIINCLIQSFLRNKKTHIIVQNPDDMKILNNLNIGKKNISLIKGVGVNTKKFSPNNISNDIPRVILACRMLWSKGIKTFVECAEQIRKEGYEVDFILAGKPDEKNPDSVPKNILEEYNKNNIIKWIGHVEDISKELVHYDIMLFPSLYGEGVPKILLEAASTSLPIITYDVPGCREVVIDGVNGFLIKADDKKELIKRLKELILDLELRVSLGKNGRKIIVNSFSSDDMNNETIKVWNKINI